MPLPRMRWGCWRWWRGRTWSRPKGRTGRTGGGGSPGKRPPDRVISAVDRQARHTRKCKPKRRDGFRGHVAAEPETGLITDCEMTMASGEGSTDAENGVKMADRDRFRGTGTAPAGTAGDAADGPGSARDHAEPADAGPAAAPQAGGLEVYGDSA
jgi:hypothetical protein